MGYFKDDATVTGNSAECKESAAIGSVNNFEDEVLFYDDPRAQMDGGAKCSVTNMISLLHNVRFYSKKFKCNMRMHGATSKHIITPAAEGYLRI